MRLRTEHLAPIDPFKPGLRVRRFQWTTKTSPVSPSA